MATQPPPVDADEESDVERRNADVCTVVGAVEEVGSKWKLVILNDLRDGEKRFNELKRSTGRVLTRFRASLMGWRKMDSLTTAWSWNRQSQATTH